VRADLARPERPTGREEANFLIGSAAVIIAVAQLSDSGSATDVLLLLPAFLGFVLRGLVPTLPAEVFAALVVAPVALVVSADGELEGSFFLVVIMVLYTAWHLGSTARALVILAVATATPLAISTAMSPDAGIVWTPWASAMVFTFFLARGFRRQQALIDELEQARGALAEQAVAEERRRMARELHDVAGHTLAAMLLHITGARHVLRRDIDEAERALEEAETVGRSSLDQIRGVVAALRTHERGTDPALGGSDDLSTLVAEYRRAGLAIAASVDASTVGLDGPVGIALYRIAREALANVARHAPGNEVDLAVDVEGDTVHLVVEDRGRPGAVPDPNAGRFGLVGMRERALALGGRLDAGPTGEGWRVELRLPTAIAVDTVNAAGATACGTVASP
jgi:signal transduction histidine kinase